MDIRQAIEEVRAESRRLERASLTDSSEAGAAVTMETARKWAEIADVIEAAISPPCPER